MPPEHQIAQLTSPPSMSSSPIRTRHLTAFISKQSIASAYADGVQEIREPKSGLSLRLGKNRATFRVRYRKNGKPTHFRLGRYAPKPNAPDAPPDAISISRAREFANLAAVTERLGGDVERSLKQAMAPADALVPLVEDEGRWGAIVARYVEARQEQESERGLKTKKRYLEQAFDADLPLASITTDDVISVRNRLEAENKLKKAHDTVCAIRRVIAFANNSTELAPFRCKDLGIAMIETEYSPNAPKTDTDRTIPLKELRDYARRLNASNDPNDIILLFLLGSLYRAEPALRLEHDLLADRRVGDETVLTVEIPQRRRLAGSKRMNSIPILSPIREKIQYLRAINGGANGDSAFLFPQRRRPRAGGLWGPLSVNALRRHLDRTTARTPSGPYALKMFRQCFATHHDRASIPFEYREYMMSHRTEKTVTEKHYNFEDLIEPLTATYRSWYRTLGLID